MDVLMPPIAEYAGRRKTFLALLNRKVSWETVRHWTSGRRRPPAWVRTTLANHLKRKSAELARIAELLENEKAGD